MTPSPNGGKSAYPVLSAARRWFDSLRAIDRHDLVLLVGVLCAFVGATLRVWWTP